MIQVNIGDAKTRLSELVAAALRGEDVVLARAGTPQVRLVIVEEADAARRQRIGEQRSRAFGILKETFAGHDTSLAALKADHADGGERSRRKLGLPD